MKLNVHFCTKLNKPNNHRLRDKNGKTVCPELLKCCCRGCGISGHTIGYCKKAKNNSVSFHNNLAPVLHVPNNKKSYTDSVKYTPIVDASTVDASTVDAPVSNTPISDNNTSLLDKQKRHEKFFSFCMNKKYDIY